MLLRYIRLLSIVWAASAPAIALDYADSATVRESPELDLGNLFTWSSQDRTKVYVLLSLAPTSSDVSDVWSTTGKYRIHLDRDNDLREDIYFDFFFAQNRELAITTGPESVRGSTGQILSSPNWRAFAGVTENFVHGDFEGLKQFFSAGFPCRPSAEKGLRCGSGSAQGAPADSALDQKIGFAALELDAEKFGLTTQARINVWASAWKFK